MSIIEIESQMHSEIHSPRYVFRRGEFNTWEFAFNSAVRKIGGDLKGYEYLARLIHQPRTWVSPIDLAHIKDSPGIRNAMTKECNHDLLDPESIKQYRDRQAFLIKILAERDNAELEQELRSIGEFMKLSSRPDGRTVKLGTPSLKKACQRVQNAMKRALLVLWEADLQDLAQHLSNCARPDNYLFVYREANPPPWDVNWLPLRSRS